MVIISSAMEEMASVAAPWGQYTDGDALPTVQEHWGPWQRVHGQQAECRPIRWIRGGPPATQEGFLCCRDALQKPTEILPAGVKPKGSVPLATAAKASPQPTPPAPTPKGRAQAEPRTCPAPPSGPPARQEQEPLQEGPVQAEVLRQLVAALGQWQQQQTALSQQQTALQEQAIALQAAMQQLQVKPRPQQQQQQPMPPEEASMQVPMQYAMHQAVPLKQAGVQEHLGSTMPLATGLGVQAMWSEDQGAASGNAAVASCGGAGGSGSAASANCSAGAASGSAGAASGIVPSADACQWPEKEANELKGAMVQAQKFFTDSIQYLGITVEHRADC